MENSSDLVSWCDKCWKKTPHLTSTFYRFQIKCGSCGLVHERLLSLEKAQDLMESISKAFDAVVTAADQIESFVTTCRGSSLSGSETLGRLETLLHSLLEET